MTHELSEYQLIADSYTLPLVGEDGEREPHTLRKDDLVFGYELENDPDFLVIVAVTDANGKTGTRVYDPIHGAADKRLFKETGRKMEYTYDDTCDGFIVPCNLARVEVPKNRSLSGWIKVEEGNLPKPYLRVVGLWEEQSMICYRSREGDWCDELHRCYCYTAPKYFAYLPEEFNDKF